ncbi:MAG: RNA 3'-terminal phosphate cyclase [Verrucomicrobia bacterium]|nr:RNA 3'-terminal phosphate cyclase [Verrucomicrobiota bacterium]
MIEIDGSVGEGGGQILRTSLSLSLLTGQPVRVTSIRAGRRKPGILRQHLTAIRAALEISGGVADGAELGSRELVFRPEKIVPGDYRFAVGTAGSATLVLQTILPALMLASGPSQLVLEGGTHNPLAPPFDFLERTFLPQLARFGPQVTARLDRPGFYPAGGGRIDISITPVTRLQPVELLERGADGERALIVHLAALPNHLAQRAFERLCARLNWPDSCCQRLVHSSERGPGLAVVAQVSSEQITETFSGFGERGLKTEALADELAEQVRRYLASTAPVGEYLADQLLLPLALAGRGAFRATGLSLHARTNLEVIAKFLPVRWSVEPQADGSTVVALG